MYTYIYIYIYICHIHFDVPPIPLPFLKAEYPSPLGSHPEPRQGGQCPMERLGQKLMDAVMGDTPTGYQVGFSKNTGTPKSSILIGFSIINHPFWVPLFLETPKWIQQID